jgi:hypothetical protein
MLDPIVLVTMSMRCVVIETEGSVLLTFDAWDLHIEPTYLIRCLVLGGWAGLSYMFGHTRISRNTCASFLLR